MRTFSTVEPLTSAWALEKTVTKMATNQPQHDLSNKVPLPETQHYPIEV
jgi:hypothetical protein